MGLFNKIFDKKKYKAKASNYKMNTLEDIEAIPVPTEKFEYDCDFKESIEYVLQRKATQFKQEGRMDLAIACLRKANMIMPYAPMSYSKKDYNRLEEYLKLDKQFNLAKAEKENDTAFYQKQQKASYQQQILNNISGADMIEVLRDGDACSECAKLLN